MLLRLTDKLATRLKVAPLGVAPLQSNPLMDWSGHFFNVGRAPYMIVLNTATLYGVVFEARGVTDAAGFVRSFITAISDTLRLDGLADGRIPLIAEERDAIVFGKSLNRKVTGSMNDMVLRAGYLLSRGTALVEVIHQNNHTPMSALEDVYPIRAFARIGI